jgi:hypothetical protein
MEWCSLAEEELISRSQLQRADKGKEAEEGSLSWMERSGALIYISQRKAK